MLLTPEVHKRARYSGATMVRRELESLTRTSMPPELMESYAAGAIEAVRDFLQAFVSDKAAYEVLQGAADQCASSLVGLSAATERSA